MLGYRGVLIAASLALCSGSALGADTRIDPYVEAGALYNDNYTLEPLDARVIKVSGAFVDAGVLVRNVTPRLDWRVEPRVRSTYYPDEGDFQSTDVFLSGAAELRSERSVFGVEADIWDQDVVSSQLPGADFGDATLGESSGPDSGRILGADNRQRVYRARPYATFELSRLMSLRLDARADDVSFDRNISGALESYRSYGVGAALDRELSPASRVALRADLQRVEPDAGVYDADIAGMHVQWDYQVAERVSGYIRAGARRSKFDVAAAPGRPAASITETTPVFAAGGRWSFRKSELFVDLQRAVDANSSGFVVERDELRVYFTHRLTPKFSGYGAAYAIRDEAVSAAALYSARRYYTLAAGAEWRLTQAWSLRGQLEHSRQEYVGESGVGDGNAIRASVLYRPRRSE
jgi:hypothetical protein